jgi:tetratricopeptide (TPR) repeat protein
MRIHTTLSRALAPAFLALAMWPVASFSLEPTDRSQLDKSMAENRFLSAWQTLVRLDPEDADLETVMRKAQVLAHARVLAASPDTYWLRDGLPTADDPTTPAETLTAVNYPLVSTLEAKARLYPTNAGLWTLLGTACWQAMESQGANAGKGPALAHAAEAAYAQALRFGSGDRSILWRLGLLAEMRGDHAQAAAYLTDALRGQEGNADLRFDLAYSLWLKADYGLAAEQAQAALGAAGTDAQRYRAKLLQAEILLSKGDANEASAVFAELYRLDNTNLYPLRRMIECDLLLGNNPALEQHTLQYAESLPVNPDSISRLTMLFLKHQKQELLFAVTKALKQQYAKTRPEISGLMCVYEAMVLVGTGQRSVALAALDEARGYLGTTYGPDHPVSLKIQELQAAARQ